MRAKLLAVGALVSAGVGLSSVGAAAQDCFIANRSTQGNLMAGTHSSEWRVIDVNAFLSRVAGCQPSTITAVDAALTAAGLPLITASRTDKVLPDNGHGILHLDDTLFPIIGQTVFRLGDPCGANLVHH